jgi:hypothetical protein
MLTNMHASTWLTLGLAGVTVADGAPVAGATGASVDAVSAAAAVGAASVPGCGFAAGDLAPYTPLRT